MKKPSILPAIIIIALIIIGGGYYLWKNKTSISLNQSVNIKRDEPKTEDFITQKTKDYWEAHKFKDYRVVYQILDNKTKAAINEEEFVKRQEYLDKNTLSGANPIQEIKIGQVTLLDDKAEVRVIINTMIMGEYNDMTKFVYENGQWLKIFDNWEALSIGKSWDEFESANKITD